MRQRLSRFLLYIFLVTTSLMMAYPLLFAFVAGFTSTEEYYQSTWFPAPTELHFDKWTAFLSRGDLWLWLFNTLIRVAWYIVVPATISVLCGYVFTVPHFKGRDTVFMLMLASMMVPGIVYLLPTFIMLARWPLVGGNDIYGQGGHGFINTWGALLIPGLINAFYIFLMRQSFQGIPRDYEEAARVDGANTLQIIWQIYVPLLRPALIVLVIFQFVAIWNDYLNPLVFAGGNEDIAPIALGAQRFIFSTSQNTRAGMIDYPTMFAVATIVTLPVVILFLLLQRYFVQGVAGFGLKG